MTAEEENREVTPEDFVESPLSPDMPETPEAGQGDDATPPDDPTPLFESAVRSIQKRLQSNFVFRKLGLCYDYAAPADAFPPKTLPTQNEARAGEPNQTGFGTGMASCTVNGALLFDGYLLRLEIGIAGASEERIFDRLIGGLIRTATSAPKGELIRGLTPDGRGYYAQSDLASYMLWAFSAWRCVRTAAIAPESQGKVENIVSKWMQRLEQDQWKLAGSSAEAGTDLTALSWDTGPCALAMAAIAASTVGNDHWRSLLEEWLKEPGRLNAPLPQEPSSLRALLTVQIALCVLRQELGPEAEQQAAIKSRMDEIAALAMPALNQLDQFKAALLDEEPDLEWRALSDEEKAGLAEGKLPIAWRRIRHEGETVQAAVEAALILLLTGDKDRAEAVLPRLEALFQDIPWETLWLADALAPLISLHARGVEMELWDQALFDRPHLVDRESVINIAQYLDPAYDEENQKRAGHTEAPRKPETKEKPRRGKRGRRRRRRRRR